MVDATHDNSDRREVMRLLDELEQLRTALEASSDEVSRLAEDRDRLLRRVTAQSRDLQAANAAYADAVSRDTQRLDPVDKSLSPGDQEQEELRVAFEEMQVLTEELEVANNSLHEANKALDRRVEERTRELAANNEALTQSELRFRSLIEGMPQLVWRAEGNGDWTWASPQWQAYTGQSLADSLGSGWLRALHPDDRATAQAAWALARPGAPLDWEGRLFHAGEGRYRHFRTRAAAIRTEGGEVLEWLGTSTDVDDLLQMRARQHVLVAELQHRTRNLMGVVSATFESALASSRDLDTFAVRYRDRIAALMRVQSMLSRLNTDSRVMFDDLIRDEIAAMGASDRVILEGPSGVALRSSTVQTFALALHELATNAVKYGALKQPTGRLVITWWLEPPRATAPHDQPWLHVDWSESGVTMATPNSGLQGAGQGRQLIERALPYQLGAKTTYVMGPDGVRCSIAVPVSARTTAEETNHDTAPAP